MMENNFENNEIQFSSAKEVESGVSMVHQELNLVQQTTVMDICGWGGIQLKISWLIKNQCTIILKKFLSYK